MADSFTCPRCDSTSYHPTDVVEGYCGHCHDWIRDSDWVNPVTGHGEDCGCISCHMSQVQ